MAQVAKFKVVKVNRRGKAQNRILELNFTDGIIANLNSKGKVQKMHHASKIMFAEKVGESMLVMHFPEQKDYKLNFVTPHDRDLFCAKLVDLCKTSRVNTNEPLQEVMFDPKKHASFSKTKTSFTFNVKCTYGHNDMALEDSILYIGKDGIAVCEHSSEKGTGVAAGSVLNPEGQIKESSQAHKVKQFYPYAHVRSWENHGDLVIIEVARKKKSTEGGGGGTTITMIKCRANADTCNSILKAIHACIQALMERKKAEKAAKKVEPAKEVTKATQKERMRRASLVVDVAALADFVDDDVDDVITSPAGGGKSDFHARRKSVLAGTERRASLLADVSGLMASMGGTSESEMMAAACAAVDLEDKADVGDVAGAKVMTDIVGVLAKQSAGADTTTKAGERRMSLMADLTGETNPTAGSERERRASMLLDLAAFIEQGEDGTGAGHDSVQTTTFAAAEEEDEDEDIDGLLGELEECEDEGSDDDFYDELALGTPMGATSTI